MPLQRSWKILLTGALSALLFSCAGSPPKMERPIKMWSGTPERGSICRLTQSQVGNMVHAIAQFTRTKSYASKVLARAMAADAFECIRAEDPKFATFAGITFDDLRVLLQYQENLLYSCERWKK